MSNIGENLKVTVNNTEGLNCELQIELPKSVYDEQYNKVLDYVAKTTSVPGFRKGKVPRSVIKQKYSNYITDQLASDIKTEALEEAIKKEELKIASINDLSELDITDELVKFSANVELHPNLENINYSELNLNLLDIDADIDKELETWLENYRQEKVYYKDLKETRSPKRGEWAKIDVKGYNIEGVTEKPSDQNDLYFYLPKEDENYYSDTVVNNKIVELLETMQVGDSKEFNVKYPDDYKDDFFKGKTVSGTVVYKALAEKVIPELSDEMVKNDKSLMVDTVEGLKSYFRETIKNTRAKQQEEELVDQVKKQLLEKNDFSVPLSQIESEKEHLKQHWGRLSDEELSKKALENVKFRYIVGEIIAKENLNVKPEDLQSRLPKDTSNIKKEDLSRILSNIENSMLWTNFISYIKENANINYYNPLKGADKDTEHSQATV